MILVYSLGGSVIAGRDAKSLSEYAGALMELAADHQVYVVVGGGRIAREYIEKARLLGASEMFCDLIGIGATKLNSALLVAALGDSAPQEIPDSYALAARLASPGKIVVMGGVAPGQTTDAVAALLAEYVHADRLIIPTSVDGVYTADPERDPSAKKLATMTHQALAAFASQTEMKAGSRSPVDPLAAKIIERSRIPTAIVLGSKIENLKKGALGGHTGTEIRPV
ncbi:MAG TPA: UMP kinase [Methanothrix sp.]|nr:UMP kinase [Methanothrix sp.]HPT19023.1 UMP kinase [Methanothrix sp.]